MPLDAAAIGRGCAAEITQANQLCGLELDRFKQALADGAPITVACTQEAPLFREVAENSPQAQLTFVNIRETGGWSKDAAAAGPKGRGADCRGGRRHAADFAGDAGEQRRRTDLWPRRGRHRGGAASRRSPRHHRAADQARRRDPAPNATNSRFSRARSATPADISGVRACDRRLCAAVRLPRARSSCSDLRAMARPRPAI